MDGVRAELSLIRMGVMERPRLIWDVDKFTKMRAKIISGSKEREILSPVFETHENGYHMMLALWPDGEPEGQESHSTSVSVFAIMREGPCDDTLSWPFRACIKVNYHLVIK